jgi:hypothetical protein
MSFFSPRGRRTGSSIEGARDGKADRYGLRHLDGVMETPGGEPTHPDRPGGPR